MTIKIAYRTEVWLDTTHHIAEAVTPDGKQLRYTHAVSDTDLARHGVIIADAAKRRALHSLIDDAIHKGLL